VKLPSFRRLNKADFKQDFQDLVDTLSVSLNNGIEVLYNVLNRNISLTDNIYCDVTDIKVVTDSLGNPIRSTSYPLTLKTKAIGVSIIDINNETDPLGYPTSGVTISFTRSNNSIIINNITGLRPGQTYALKIITWG